MGISPAKTRSTILTSCVSVKLTQCPAWLLVSLHVANWLSSESVPDADHLMVAMLTVTQPVANRLGSVRPSVCTVVIVTKANWIVFNHVERWKYLYPRDISVYNLAISQDSPYLILSCVRNRQGRWIVTAISKQDIVPPAVTVTPPPSCSPPPLPV